VQQTCPTCVMVVGFAALFGTRVWRSAGWSRCFTLTFICMCMLLLVDCIHGICT
jgi:hypothetical protein